MLIFSLFLVYFWWELYFKGRFFFAYYPKFENFILFIIHVFSTFFIDSLVPLMFTEGFTFSDASIFTKLGEIQSRRSLEEEVLTKLVTTFSDDVASQASVKINAPPGPPKDCLQTLFANAVDPEYKRMSFFSSSARKETSKQNCEAAGHCWTDYAGGLLFNGFVLNHKILIECFVLIQPVFLFD